MTPERKAELRLLLDSRVEKWKSDVGWWAAVAEELLDALGAREQTPTAGGAQAGRADEAADTAGASAAGEKPGALTLAYEYLRSWRAHHVASGKSAAHLAGFDEALTHLAAAPEREIQPPAPVALPGLSEGELVRAAMGLLMAATTDQVLIHIIDLRADYQQLVRERGEAWLATKTEAPVALPEAVALDTALREYDVSKRNHSEAHTPGGGTRESRNVADNAHCYYTNNLVESARAAAATVRELQRALTAAERTISQHDAEDFEHIQKGLAREAKLSELQRERDEASELANQTARMQADSTDASVSAEMAWMLECDTAIREQDEARAEVTTLRTRVNLDALGGHEADAVALVEARAEVARLTTLGEKVSAIRDSIVAMQTVNWSEHIYPLVAALDEAGFAGAGYPGDRENFGTLLERATKAEAEVARLQKALDHLTPTRHREVKP